MSIFNVLKIKLFFINKYKYLFFLFVFSLCSVEQIFGLSSSSLFSVLTQKKSSPIFKDSIQEQVEKITIDKNLLRNTLLSLLQSKEKIYQIYKNDQTRDISRLKADVQLDDIARTTNCERMCACDHEKGIFAGVSSDSFEGETEEDLLFVKSILKKYDYLKANYIQYLKTFLKKGDFTMPELFMMKSLNDVQTVLCLLGVFPNSEFSNRSLYFDEKEKDNFEDMLKKINPDLSMKYVNKNTKTYVHIFNEKWIKLLLKKKSIIGFNQEKNNLFIVETVKEYLLLVGQAEDIKVLSDFSQGILSGIPSHDIYTYCFNPKSWKGNYVFLNCQWACPQEVSNFLNQLRKKTRLLQPSFFTFEWVMSVNEKKETLYFFNCYSDILSDVHSAIVTKILPAKLRRLRSSIIFFRISKLIIEAQFINQREISEYFSNLNIIQWIIERFYCGNSKETPSDVKPLSVDCFLKKDVLPIINKYILDNKKNPKIPYNKAVIVMRYFWDILKKLDSHCLKESPLVRSFLDRKKIAVLFPFDFHELLKKVGNQSGDDKRVLSLLLYRVFYIVEKKNNHLSNTTEKDLVYIKQIEEEFNIKLLSDKSA